MHIKSLIKKILDLNYLVRLISQFMSEGGKNLKELTFPTKVSKYLRVALNPTREDENPYNDSPT